MQELYSINIFSELDIYLNGVAALPSTVTKLFISQFVIHNPILKFRVCQQNQDNGENWAEVKIKTSVFNLQYISHFCMDFYVSNTSRCIVERPF